MKVLILGGGGMLGHKLWQQFAADFDISVTVRSSGDLYARHGLNVSPLIPNVNADNLASVRSVIEKVRPDVVINCIGIIKQLPTAKDPTISISVNSLLPHQLAATCLDADARLIHFSTDCVFSGELGMYKETDNPDPVDLYGRSKLLGEISREGCVTIRSSIIGPELGTASGLVEWFLSQRGRVNGYRGAIYSGFTTLEMSRIVKRLITDFPKLSGVHQISSEPINKYDLLCLIKRVYGRPNEIVAVDEPIIDRSLDSFAFRSLTGFVPPSWEQMIEEMHVDAGRNLNAVASKSL